MRNSQNESQLSETYEINNLHFVVDKQQVLGKGSFGKVYGGTYYMLPIAVKKLKASSTAKAINDFKNEIQTLM